MKKTMSAFALASLLGVSALVGADFSKTSLKDLQSMAGKVAPKDVLDYRIEINKRMEAMTIKDARAFHMALHKNAKENHAKMSTEELKKYKEAVREETRKQLDNMTVKEAKEKGVFKGFGHQGRKFKKEKSS